MTLKSENMENCFVRCHFVLLIEQKAILFQGKVT